MLNILMLEIFQFIAMLFDILGPGIMGGIHILVNTGVNFNGGDNFYAVPLPAGQSW